MAKRKKYPKLPNGYGSIKFLGKGRRNPYGVYTPVRGYDLDGKPIEKPKALCYVDSWIAGFAVLTSYHAGTYKPGDERKLIQIDTDDKIVQQILADYNRAQNLSIENSMTFSDVYQAFYKYKFDNPKGKKLSPDSVRATKFGYKHCSTLHNRLFAQLRHKDLQAVIDNCKLKHASLEHIRSLLKQMYEYAEINDIVDRNYAAHLKINIPDDDEHGIALSDDELKILWENKDDETVEWLLIMCYSGFRISEYYSLDVNLKEGYFKGGIKTKAGKNRIVPIHSGIYSIVKKHTVKNKLDIINSSTFRKNMDTTLKQLKIIRHTPHDCRHTFSRLCEKYEVKENDRKRMLGHSFKGDITNEIYGHREFEDLKKEIEKIQICC